MKLLLLPQGVKSNSTGARGASESKKTWRRRRVGAAAAAAATDMCGIAAGRREGSGGAWSMISGRRRHTPAGAEQDPEAERRNTLAKADRIIAITSLLLLLNPLPSFSFPFFFFSLDLTYD
uniref:Uncharacterized protein n=1 Tax=Oryza sativa subsp. japonica TaxID=39947 RepID=Q8LHY6_ORYSJ|nr:hypothetical protein [Oryza sativa Japonica Group]